MTYDDLNGITEIIPNKEYKIRMTTGTRVRKVVHGNLMKAISEKNKLNKNIIVQEYQAVKQQSKVVESVTVEEAVNRTINYLVELGENTDAIDLNTVYDYVDRFNMYVYDFFPRESKLSTINENKVKDFIAYMFNRERKDGKGLLSVRSVEKAYSTIGWLIRYCSEISDPPLLKENCLSKIRFKTLIPKGRTKVRKVNKGKSTREIMNLVKTLDTKANIRLKTIVNIFVDVGCRDEECFALKWKNINMSTGEVNYVEAVTSSISQKNSLKHSGIRIKTLKSKHSYRNNYLTNHTLDLLTKLKIFKEALGLSVKPDDYIFTIWADNTILSPISFADEFKDFMKKYGIENITPYDFRHSLTNLLLESGMSPKDVAQYVGNTPRTLLESYTDMREETGYQIKEIISEKIRSKKREEFNIDTIAYVLNCSDKIGNNKKAYALIDFLTDKKVTEEEESWAIECSKNIILEQFPNLKSFCNSDDNIVKAKIETFKDFNGEYIELIQDNNYHQKINI